MKVYTFLVKRYYRYTWIIGMFFLRLHSPCTYAGTAYECMTKEEAKKRDKLGMYAPSRLL